MTQTTGEDELKWSMSAEDEDKMWAIHDAGAEAAPGVNNPYSEGSYSWRLWNLGRSHAELERKVLPA